MKKIEVEGFEVRIERGEKSGFVLTIPKLPGIVGQVAKEEEAAREAGRLIGAHLRELVSMKPRLRRKRGGGKGGNDGDKKPKIRK